MHFEAGERPGADPMDPSPGRLAAAWEFLSGVEFAVLLFADHPSTGRQRYSRTAPTKHPGEKYADGRGKLTHGKALCALPSSVELFPLDREGSNRAEFKINVSSDAT